MRFEMRFIFIYVMLFCTTLFADCARTENEIQVHTQYDDKERLIRKFGTDGSFDYYLVYSGNKTIVFNKTTKETLIQEHNEGGNLIRETFPTGLSIYIEYESQQPSIITLPDESTIEYTYHRGNIRKVIRRDNTGQMLYEHTYLKPFLHETREVLIGELGLLKKTFSPFSQMLSITSPFIEMQYTFDQEQKVLSKEINGYTETFQYDAKNQLILDESYDIHGNSLEAIMNTENQCIEYHDIHCTYDFKGRLDTKKEGDVLTQFEYDALDRLIKVITDTKIVEYTYDILDRRLSKTIHIDSQIEKEHSIYLGTNEIAIYDADNNIKHLRILGASFHKNLPISIAIESDGKIFAPVYDHSLNIAMLVDINNRSLIDYTTLHPFGTNLPTLPYTPWLYATKHFDAETNLVYFGARYYDPSLRRWISQDPLGTIDSENLYAYVLNNPFTYIDPDGRFLIAIPLFVGVGAILDAVIDGLIVGACALGGAKIIDNMSKSKDKKKKNDDWDKQKNGPPKNNIDQNKQARDAKKEIEQRLGRKLTKKEERKFHREITKQRYSYQELVEEGYWLFQ